MLFLVRLQVAATAAWMNLTIDDVDDLRLAVDELCIELLARPLEPESRLDVVLLWDGDQVEVVCGVAIPATGAVPAAPTDGLGDQLPALGAALSGEVLNALVDEHGNFTGDGQAVSWLRKRFPMAATTNLQAV